MFSISLTWSVYSKPITTIRKDLTAGGIDHWLRQALLLTHMLDEFHGDLLYRLKRLLPEQRRSAPRWELSCKNTLPPLGLLCAFEIVLPLQFCDERIVRGNLGVCREVEVDGWCHTKPLATLLLHSHVECDGVWCAL